MFYFTAKDANLVLPDVIKKFEIALEKKNEILKMPLKLKEILMKFLPRDMESTGL